MNARSGTVTEAEVHRIGDVTELVLAAPERRNALSLTMRTQLLAEVRAAVDDPRCHGILLRGASGTFCSGGVLAELADTAGAPHRLAILNDLVETVLRTTKPVVCALEGQAVGSGLSLAMACDAIVADARAELVFGFARLGLTGDGGITWTLPRRVGANLADRYLGLTCPISASEAARAGLIDAVASPGTARATALEHLRALAHDSPPVRRMPRAGDTELEAARAALDREADASVAVMQGERFGALVDDLLSARATGRRRS